MIDTLLKMSATGAVVICTVLVLRLCLRRAPKIFSYVLWLIVLFRLLCPVSVALPVSVFNLIPSAQTNVTDQLPAREHPGNGAAIQAERCSAMQMEIPWHFTRHFTDLWNRCARSI